MYVSTLYGFLPAINVIVFIYANSMMRSKNVCFNLLLCRITVIFIEGLLITLQYNFVLQFGNTTEELIKYI